MRSSRRSSTSRRSPPKANSRLPSWDYLALAQAFGVKGFRVETIDQLAAALTEIAALADMPALVEVVIPEKDLAPQLARLAAPPPTLRKYSAPE
jgi:indolepyruvate decarboxylase